MSKFHWEIYSNWIANREKDSIIICKKKKKNIVYIDR